MNDTLVTVVGNAATQVEYRETAGGGMARFRIAVTPRRWDKQSAAWIDGRTGFYTVFAWRSLAINLAGSVSVGEPLVVHGRLRVREEEREGQRRTSVDIEAMAVGHDLTRGTAAFRRGGRTGAPATTEPTSGVLVRSPGVADGGRSAGGASGRAASGVFASQVASAWATRAPEPGDTEGASPPGGPVPGRHGTVEISEQPLEETRGHQGVRGHDAQLALSVAASGAGAGVPSAESTEGPPF
ncbi:single-stranded DNA-binding protein [Streptomyces sp. NPDC005963]|uniref:single-stranded DNA-binding protein n=1 Tax=Streptomyces sp. NPDC005963 TaxID=3156721 RepID=UPI0033DFCA50